MKIVIDIDEGLYEWVHRQIAVDEGWSEIQAAIMDGTPLPKGHGRLIDADALPLDDIDSANYGSNYILIAPTIIEADGEVEE